MTLLYKQAISICIGATIVGVDAYVVRSPLLTPPAPVSSQGVLSRQPLVGLSTRKRILPTGATSTSTSLHAMIPYEQLMEKLPSKAVIDAVSESKNDKVVAADVATVSCKRKCAMIIPHFLVAHTPLDFLKILNIASWC